MKDSDVCYHHGGKTPRGIASPHYKNGKSTPWVDILPKHLSEAFMASYSDPKLLSLRKNIALSVARIEQLLAALMRDDAPLTWEQLVQARAGFYKAQATGRTDAATVSTMAPVLRSRPGATAARGVSPFLAA